MAPLAPGCEPKADLGTQETLQAAIVTETTYNSFFLDDENVYVSYNEIQNWSLPSGAVTNVASEPSGVDRKKLLGAADGDLLYEWLKGEQRGVRFRTKDGGEIDISDRFHFSDSAMMGRALARGSVAYWDGARLLLLEHEQLRVLPLELESGDLVRTDTDGSLTAVIVDRDSYARVYGYKEESGLIEVGRTEWPNFRWALASSGVIFWTASDGIRIWSPENQNSELVPNCDPEVVAVGGGHIVFRCRDGIDVFKGAARVRSIPFSEPIHNIAVGRSLVAWADGTIMDPCSTRRRILAVDEHQEARISRAPEHA